MQTQYQKVREFMQAFGQECPPYPVIPPRSVRELRWKLINEEGVIEFGRAANRVEKFDAILDTRYVTYGAAIAYGHQEDSLFDASLDEEYLTEWNRKLHSAKSHTAILHSIVGIFSWIRTQEVQLGFSCSQVLAGFDEVHRSNLSKFWSLQESDAFLRTALNPKYIFKQSPCGRFVVKNYDGKIIKSPSYSPANLGPILEGKV